MADGSSDQVPLEVLDAYGFASGASRVEPLAGGLINRTFVVRDSGEPRAVLQALHPIFAAEVNIDLDVVTRHLADAGLETPRLVRTRDGARWVAVERAGAGSGEPTTEIWRVLSHVEGTTLHRVDDPESARAAAALVGRFHQALGDLEYDYAFARLGVHDTAEHLARLRRALEGHREAPGHPGGDPAGGDPAGDLARDRDHSSEVEAILQQALVLGDQILAAAAALPALGDLPLRHCHGDLKISNVLFAPGDPTRARCLLDLDTLGRQTLAYELGDALRSWCNPRGEDVAEPCADPAIYTAAMDGYLSTAGHLVTPAERASIVPGWQTICVELAARFCVDVFDDSYFGWNPARHASRREHNLVRARGQLALARSVESQRLALSAVLA